MCIQTSKIPNLELGYMKNTLLIKCQHFETSDKMILNLSRKHKYVILFLNPVELIL